MNFNLADLFEIAVDTDPDREVLVVGDRRLSYAQLDERANRLAHHLQASGVKSGDHVGLQLYNGTEYIEGMLAAFKIRAVPINVNYRYVEEELRYLFNDADLVALLVNRSFTACVAGVVATLPALSSFLVVDDDSGVEANLPGAIDYEQALADASPVRDFAPRSADDLYCVYTGGTTGMPKGVLWRHEDIFFGALGGGDPLQSGDYISTPAELSERQSEQGLVVATIPPFMHAAAHWAALHQLFTGGKVVVLEGGRFDPVRIWDLVGREHINLLVVVGDAMARPLADELASDSSRFDTSSLLAIGSGGAILSRSTKDQFRELLPNTIVVDAFGSSETGPLGSESTMSEGEPAEGLHFSVDDKTAVLDTNFKPVVAGSGEIGLLARSGHIPLGYYKDEKKTATTFVTAGGKRWVLPGDMAKVDGNGMVILLGRNSVSISTGGEKVFPEEVEMALKAHPSVLDAVVVGVPDSRWGERIVGIVQARGTGGLESSQLLEHCRGRIAAYKIPRDLVVVDKIVRSPAGKADYRWAKECALEELGCR